MRLASRALALLASTTLSIGALASPAHAASPQLVSAVPAPNSHHKTDPAGVTLTFDQPVAPSSTIVVTGPAAAPPCMKNSPTGEPSAVLSCTFVPSGNLPDGAYTVNYTADSTGADQATAGSYTFHLDSVAPPAPTATITPDPYNEASTTLTVDGTSQSAGDTVEVTLSNGPSVTKAATAGSGGTYSASFTAAEVATLNQGTLTATATSTDAAGNSGASGTDTAIKDTVDPTLVSTSPSAGGSANSAGSATRPPRTRRWARPATSRSRTRTATRSWSPRPCPGTPSP